MALLSVAAAAAAATAVGMYLDARYSIRSDLAQMSNGRRIQAWIRHLYEVNGADDWSFYHVIHSTYHLRESHGNITAFIFEGRTWSYDQFRQEIGRVAKGLARLGVKNRTVVGLFINNSPEFMFIWWALFKLGAVPAPINTGLAGEPVKHCLRVCDAEFMVCSMELYGSVTSTFSRDDAIRPEIVAQSGANVSFNDPSVPRVRSVIIYDYETYPVVVERASSLPGGFSLLRHEDLPPVTPAMGDWPQSERPKVGPTFASQYTFTSGTTGLPKAVTWPSGFSLISTCPGRWPGMFNIPRRFYICLPMFHGTALFAAMPGTFTTSGTIILARRFSRREFWADVRRTDADATLYIGEMLRYLVQSPPDPRFPDEKNHKLTLAFGLGLAPTVWRAFRARFGVEWIVEYYSSTEATISLQNSNKNDLGVGKVARYGPLLRSQWFGQTAFYIVKTDLITGDVQRDPKTGFCSIACPGEIGASISRIVPPIRRRHDYVGEEGAEASEKKTLRNVFQEGDEFVNLGDALMLDRDGFISFSDRLGDTYRVKGHNISTTEVENILSHHPRIASVNVFAIPMNHFGYDGQLGCAAVTFQHEGSANVPGNAERETISQLENWFRTSGSTLPAYAVPRFLRVLVANGNGANQTVTDNAGGGEQVSAIMKKLKVGLRKQGFSVAPESGDRVYWIEKEGSGYVPLTKEAEQLLILGQARL